MTANKKIDNFKSELKTLIKKFDFQIESRDEYDAMDEVIEETIYYFCVDGAIWYDQNISEILSECINSEV